jgi:ElaA protein
MQGFYASLGFVATGEPYLEDGIPHVEMLMKL